MSLLKHIGQAYMHLCAYECKQALALFTSLPPHHHNTGWVLTQIGRVYFELAEYHMVRGWSGDNHGLGKVQTSYPRDWAKDF